MPGPRAPKISSSHWGPRITHLLVWTSHDFQSGRTWPEGLSRNIVSERSLICSNSWGTARYVRAIGAPRRKTFSGGRTVPTKRSFKKNAPLIFFILMGPFARTLFSSNTSAWSEFCVFQGKVYLQKFSNTSFGRTLLGSNFGGLLLGQAFCRHFAAFPEVAI